MSINRHFNHAPECPTKPLEQVRHSKVWLENSLITYLAREVGYTGKI